MRWQVSRYAHINNHYTCPSMASKHVDGCAALQEIHHHLLRHIRRVSAHTLASYTVVASHHEDDFLVEMGLGLARDARNMYR